MLALWQQAWQESGIGQPTTLLSGHGLTVIDHWLDHRIKDSAVLLVVAVQIAPEQPEMTGEAVVGLLLANRLTQKYLPRWRCYTARSVPSRSKRACRRGVTGG